jgi:hypothetical protein
VKRRVRTSTARRRMSRIADRRGHSTGQGQRHYHCWVVLEFCRDRDWCLTTPASGRRFSHSVMAIPVPITSGHYHRRTGWAGARPDPAQHGGMPAVAASIPAGPVGCSVLGPKILLG